MDIWVKLLSVLGIDLLQSVFPEDFLQLHIRHAQAVVECVQVHVFLVEDLPRNALCRPRQDVRHLQQVLAEALDPEHLRVIDLFLHASTDILRLSEGALVLVLKGKQSPISQCIWFQCSKLLFFIRLQQLDLPPDQ